MRKRWETHTASKIEVHYSSYKTVSSPSELSQNLMPNNDQKQQVKLVVARAIARANSLLFLFSKFKQD